MYLWIFQRSICWGLIAISRPHIGHASSQPLFWHFMWQSRETRHQMADERHVATHSPASTQCFGSTCSLTYLAVLPARHRELRLWVHVRPHRTGVLSHITSGYMGIWDEFYCPWNFRGPSTELLLTLCSSEINWSDPNTLVTVECAPLGVQVRTITVLLPDAWLAYFAVGNFWKGELNGNYYGKLVYTDLCGKTRKEKTNGVGIMGVKVAEFYKWDVEMDKRVKHGTTGRLPRYIVLARFCAM